MPALARRERADLCDLLYALGPDAPTLCEGWTTHDLLAHLVLREGSPVAVAAVLPPLQGMADRAMGRLKAREPYPRLVERLREGPPTLSVFRPAGVDRLANAVEFFVHHEDVLRAQPGRPRRELASRDHDALWARLAGMGRMLGRQAAVGIELVRTDAPGVRRIRAGEPTLVVRGLPGELLLFAFGRGAHADVEVDGDAQARAAFDDSQLGF